MGNTAHEGALPADVRSMVVFDEVRKAPAAGGEWVQHGTPPVSTAYKKRFKTSSRWVEPVFLVVVLCQSGTVSSIVFNCFQVLFQDVSDLYHLPKTFSCAISFSVSRASAGSGGRYLLGFGDPFRADRQGCCH